MVEVVLSQEALEIVGWASVRTKRGQLMKMVDWTQMADCPLLDEKKAEFAVYRQALRDLPQSVDDPDSVVWPTKPIV